MSNAAGSWLGNIVYEVDQLGNAMTWHAVSDYGGQKDETWSSAMGKALAVDLYRHRFTTKNYEPRIPMGHPLGVLFNAICNVFQKCHSLRSIEWDEGANLESVFPGIKEVVRVYLAKKGIKK
jgi:hypothetical protein